MLKWFAVNVILTLLYLRMVMLTASVTCSCSSKKAVIMKYSLAFEIDPLPENVMGKRLRITHKSARSVVKFNP